MCTCVDIEEREKEAGDWIMYVLYPRRTLTRLERNPKRYHYRPFQSIARVYPGKHRIVLAHRQARDLLALARRSNSKEIATKHPYADFASGVEHYIKRTKKK